MKTNLMSFHARLYDKFIYINNIFIDKLLQFVFKKYINELFRLDKLNKYLKKNC